MLATVLICGGTGKLVTLCSVHRVNSHTWAGIQLNCLVVFMSGILASSHKRDFPPSSIREVVLGGRDPISIVQLGFQWTEWFRFHRMLGS